MGDSVKSEEKLVGTWEAVEPWLAKDGKVFGTLGLSCDRTVEMQIQVELYGDPRTFGVPGTWHIEKRDGDDVFVVLAKMELEDLIYTRRFAATIFFHDVDTLGLDDRGTESTWKRIASPLP